MDFSLTQEQIQLRDTVREFAAREVAPYIREWDANGEFHPEILQKMGELGLLGLADSGRIRRIGIRLRLAGAGLRRVGVRRYLLARGHERPRGTQQPGAAAMGETKSRSNDSSYPRRKARSSAPSGLTEPNAGSDAGSLESTYVRDGDAYVLNGSKIWISLAAVADHFLVFASFDRSKKHNGLTAFMLEKGMPGLTTGTIKGKLGVRAGNTGELAFNNVRIPIENRIGEEGEGFKIAMSCIDQGRFTVGAGAVGLIRACLDASVKYANERYAFDQEIGRFELVKQMIARMVASYETSRLADDAGGRVEESRHPQHPRNIPDEVVRL